MKISPRILATEWTRRKVGKLMHYGSDTDEVARIAFFEGYKMAEKEWRKKMKDALKARLGVE